MGPTIIARNYAETLLLLAQRQGGEAVVDEYAAAMEEIAGLLRDEPRIREFLETPRIDVESKQRAIRGAFGGKVPDQLMRFLLVVVEKRRQRLLPQIADEYRGLVDELRGRTRAEITLSVAPTQEQEQELTASLERRLGQTVVPTFRVDPGLIGGIIVRVGDQILDGSVRRRLSIMRRRLLEVHLPETAAVNPTLG